MLEDEILEFARDPEDTGEEPATLQEILAFLKENPLSFYWLDMWNSHEMAFAPPPRHKVTRT